MDLSFPAPPAWSLQLGSFGIGAVWAAIALFLISAFAWIFEPKSPALRRVATWSFGLGCASLFTTFLALAVLFANNRFEFEYIWAHADTKNTIPYRIAGIWSGQQGSFLLWGVCSAIFALFALRSTGQYRRWFSIPYALFLGAIAAILAYESPYGLNLLEGKPAVPAEGVGLAPSLQNYWVTIHPPTIFLGFGSLTVLFAFAIAAMATKDWISWVPRVRPWAILSATILGLGLIMGGFWAYETLGWGGFWAWDPVENTSFVPWCLTIAFIHGLIVQNNRGKWFASNLLFGILPFLSFMYGTFLTRSGFLSEVSVHSFAQMDRSALKILIGMVVLSVVASIFYWGRSLRIMKAQAPPAPTSLHREGFYRWGNIVLCSFALATAIGMSLPWLSSLFRERSVVATEADYHMVLSWFFFPIMLLMAAAPFVSWRGTGFRQLMGKLYGSFCITIGILGIAMLVISWTDVRQNLDLQGSIPIFFGSLRVSLLPWMMILCGVCVFAIVANTWRLLESIRRSRTSAPAFLSHVGLAVAIAGLMISRGFERKEQLFVQEGTPASALGYTINYRWDQLGASPTKIIRKGETQTVAGMPVTFQGTEDIATADGNKRRVANLSVKQDSANRKLQATLASTASSVELGSKQFLSVEPVDQDASRIAVRVHKTGDLMDRNNEIVFDMEGPDGKFQVTPGMYYIRRDNGETNVMAWPHIQRQPFHDIYFTVGGMELNASDVISLKPGESAQFDRVNVKMVRMTREGEPGKVGTTFGAILEVGAGPHKMTIHPKMELTDRGTQQVPDKIGGEYFMTMQGMDAATGAANLQLHFMQPLYPVEIFYKPMTIMVWIGTGILTFAGFWAALVRRRVTVPEVEPEEPVAEPKKADEGYAPAPAS